MSTEVRRERTYGNWRRPRSAGLGQLGLLGTAVLMGGMVVVILAVAIVGVLPALVLLALLALALGSLMVRDRHGKTGLQLVGVRLGWWRARSRGSHLYRSGPLGRTGWGTFQPPGLLAQSRLSEARDSYDRPFALLHVPQAAHFTVVFATEPDGASLVDEEQIDVWVARWGQWLASLGDELGVHGASVTVETAPDTGTRLRREVQARIDPRAPAVAQAGAAARWSTATRRVGDDQGVGGADVRRREPGSAAGERGVRPRAGDPPARAEPAAARHRRGVGAAARAPRSCASSSVPRMTRRRARVIEDAYAAGRGLDAALERRRPGGVRELVGSPTATTGAVSVTWAMSAASRGEVHLERAVEAAGAASRYRPQARDAALPGARPGGGRPDRRGRQAQRRLPRELGAATVGAFVARAALGDRHRAGGGPRRRAGRLRDAGHRHRGRARSASPRPRRRSRTWPPPRG